jgi:hypothetical protein
MDSQFQLEEYLDETIMHHYYNNSGYLQWNYYSVFLYDVTNLDLVKEIIPKIEKNESYSRKYIISLNDLEKWLDRKYNIQVNDEHEITQDLSIVWTKILRENNLDCIYLKDIPYTTGIESIITGRYIKENENVNKGVESRKQLEKIKHIKSLILDNYRQYPLTKEFNFGIVNIFTGKNGCGKTSLLEAIELFLCGKNYRDPKSLNSGVSVKIRFEGDNQYNTLDLNNTQLFKKRDEFWYNNPQTNANNLYLGFNRYNFFSLSKVIISYVSSNSHNPCTCIGTYLIAFHILKNTHICVMH